jgi:hypothetical protein
MPDQYRPEDEREGRRHRWSDTSRGDDRRDDRGDEGLQRGGDWRGGQSGRWNRSEPDDRGYAMSDRGGITRETGFDRGVSRDERNSRDWQQRVGEGSQGYRAQDRQSDREWQGEPDWESDRRRGWQSGRDWPQGSPRGGEQWRGSQEPGRGAREGRGVERGGYGARSWHEEGGGARDQQNREHGWWEGRRREHEQERFGTGGNREHEQERFGTGGNREREQDWSAPGRRGDYDREAGGPRGRGAWNEGFGGETWQARGEEPDRAMRSSWAHPEERQREERGREGGRGPGGGWPWGGGGPMSTWGIGGSESPRGIGGTREGAWPGYAGRGPKGYKRSDERIREQVSDCLMDDHDVDASDITVDVKDGDVTLTGTVQNREQKRRAEEVVERLNGVSEVINNLRVNRQSGEQAWQTEGQSGSRQVGQQVPIGGQQSPEGIRAGREPQGGQSKEQGAGQAATQAGQQAGQQGAQAGGGKPNRNPQSSNS